MRERSKNKNLKLLFWTPLLFLLLSPNAFPSEPQGKEEPNPDTVVEHLQKSYDSAADFVADFRQETEVKTLNRNLKAKGKVFFKRPGKMLWRYDEPKGQWLLADGKSLYFYQPEQSQIIKSPLKNVFRSDIPLSFLLGLGDLKRDFNPSFKGVQGGNYVLQLGQKGDSPGIGQIELGIDRQAFEILWTRIRDAVGNVTTIRFANLKKGIGLNDSLFRLQVPDGVDLVELGS